MLNLLFSELPISIVKTDDKNNYYGNYKIMYVDTGILFNALVS